MGNISSCCESCFQGRRSQQYEPLLLENEREAVADLLQYLENRATTNFFSGDPLSALTTLSFSDNVDLQRSAALAFAEITEKEVRPVGRDTLDPILFLLSSHDAEVQRAASAALGNLAVNTDNKLLIVKLGGLEPLIRQMLSPNVEVQCNAVGCVTNLATHDDNKSKIAKSGALVPLTRLARSKDMRVQRNATGALLNMTHSDENRQQLVNAGAIPVLVNLLNSPDTDVQYYCTTALSNIAVDAVNRKKLAQSEPKLISSLVQLMDSPSLKVQCQAALALRNLASDEKYQLEIVKCDGLQALLRLLQSTYLPLILSSAACVRNVSIHPQNESPIIESGFLQPLINLLSFKENEEVQCHAISTLRNLAASSEKNKGAIVKAGAIQTIKELVLDVPVGVQSEMTACVAVLALSDELKSQLLEMGVLEFLIPLTNSPSGEVQGNAAAAIGNLSSKDNRIANDDYSHFNDVWEKPDGGMHDYLHRFLISPDGTFQHIAVWTIVQLLESGDPQLISNIRNSTKVTPYVRALSHSRTSTPTSSVGTPHSHRSATQSQDDEALLGQQEIVVLARRILEYVEGDEGFASSSVGGSHVQPGSSIGSSQRDHEELRRSVREAFAPGSHR
ncbi:ARM repeat-containing protein [Macrolepiota fuliginosa MF-IS2]|uniref:Vacuolar protein 8 n=1 Tax=Macrolepiota fuliginosa MF-IS2 TaxID=1400762 RepID=A0A9P5XT72_9AGAR|nr:ARM repeat-containing protein [Macrolepiota fuliginosa MF-IS2]